MTEFEGKVPVKHVKRQKREAASGMLMWTEMLRIKKHS